ncbi:ATP-dependent DNA helicase PcrA [Candidatus Wolfebacteria bacterium CG10_big_fil_rev_8_21_14_0_10_31_9]|uniref:DNA 3'-5' helicase n=1 Tax=Candidatus Wolfebacteria bacterium CG10_big_fil_rev_8_21_14_0_10_31_9 TaxID=1975070 RepID=A0A2H0RCP2_9BACT|nr:MAG: ATP-dependent DNA helicase PcrA [Candidatus Wolfebacteria bacterium CG10_big_fil_rev_8_21_14_0_10_31_9]
MKFDLNKKQQEAVEHMDGPLLIVAGAGSGKTRTLTSRLVYLLQNGIKPENIIAITFTNKAAQEMRERISNYQLPISNAQNLFVGTFHSLGARILKNESKLLERTQNYTIFDNDDSKVLIKKIIKNYNLTEKQKSKITVVYLIREFSRIKNELVDIEDLQFNAEDELVAELFQEYERSLKRNNAFDFDDLLEKVVRIFIKYPEILKKYQDEFKYILVDEYQDTNTSQYLFIKLLAQKHGNLSVVGDDQQSIFKFRGSDFRNFLNFDKDWPKAKVVILEENYRSTSNIINAASSVIANNKLQKLKKLWTQNPEGELVRVIEHRDEEAEAFWIARQIGNKFAYPSIDQKQETNNSVVILYRTNAQSRAIEQALIETGIPYQIFGGIRFYERKEIKDIVAALRYGFNPNDEVSLDRLDKAFLKKVFEAFKKNLPEKAKIFKPLEFIGYIIKETDYFSYLAKNYANSFERVENIKALMDYASEFENMGDFLEKITLMQASELIKRKDLNKYKGKFVSLMTVHLVKGLEFDVVYVAGVNEGLLPHQMSYSNNLEVEEERRLMYVAMTRAKKELYLNFYNLPSRFLYEISPELVEFIGKKNLDDEERYIELD